MQTSRLIASLLGALLLSRPANAQGAPGAGDDALVLPRGTVRLRAGAEWMRFYERYGGGTTGRVGALEPLGADLTLDTIGVSQLESLFPVQAGVRTLAGMPDFTASLGRSLVRVRNHVFTTPVTLELGLTRRLSVGVMVPFVTAAADVDLRVNPRGLEPTLGLNPTLVAASAIATNASLLAQFDSAASQLGQRLALCTSNPAAPGCGPLNANRPGALALIANANAFATGLGQVYGGRGGSGGAPFVPLAGTAAQAAIEARVAAYKALYASFGTSAISAAGPLAAQAPFTIADMQRLLTDSVFGVRARPLATSVTRGVGDIDIGFKLNLVGTFRPEDRPSPAAGRVRWRQSVGGVFRLGTGTLDAPDAFTDLGTGDHQNDVEIRSYTDVTYGPNVWLSLVARYSMQAADERVMRIGETPHQVLAAAYRQQTVKRALGDELVVELTPRWALNEFVGVSGHYLYRRKSPDSYTGRFTVTDLAGQQIAIDAAALDAETAAREHRFGAGLSYSTTSAFAAGRTSVPLEITYLHVQTTRGSGGNVPKLSQDRIEVRWYGRVFGSR